MSEWIYTKDRLPTEKDADHRGFVLVTIGTGCLLRHYSDLTPFSYYAWMPPPKPPKKKIRRPPTIEDFKGAKGPIPCWAKYEESDAWRPGYLISITSLWTGARTFYVGISRTATSGYAYPLCGIEVDE